MSKFVVAVINGTQARLFTLEPAEWPEYESGPNLIERESLHSSEKELQGQELWANTKTGRNRGTSGQAHSYDDHRQNHVVEFERRFAQKITSKLVDLIRAHQAQQLLLVAEPQILGLMREAFTPTLFKNLKISELSKDLCYFSPEQIHAYLAKKELLPACQRVVYPS